MEGLFYSHRKPQAIGKEGVKFVNVEKVDKRRKAPILAAVVMIILMIATIGFLVWVAKVVAYGTAVKFK